jgi:uncharacterized protein
MRFTQDSSSAAYLVRSYGGGELRINEEVYRGAVLLSAATVQNMPELRHMDDLAALDPARILALDPEIVLLATVERHIFPAGSYRARFLMAVIGFEAMDTGAACRTFNVLVAEQRRVAALLMI